MYLQSLKLYKLQRIDCVVRSFLVLSFLLLTNLVCKAQDNRIESKVDPAFLSLINANQKLNATPKKKCFLKRKSKTRNVSNATNAEVKYDCIVYTKNADAARKTGITINSVLPSFITAKASLRQIQELALMSEVTFIASSQMNVVE